MPARGLHGLWLRGLAAAAACLLALGSTGGLVAVAAISQTGHGPVMVLTDSHGQSDGNGDGTPWVNGHGNGHGHGDGNGNGDGHGDGNGKGDGGDTGTTPRTKPAKPTHETKPAAAAPLKPSPPRPAARAASVGHTTAQVAAPAAPAAPAPTPRVVVDTTDAAPFAAQPVAAPEATRVLPVEALGPLSGISFGSGLFVWPLLLAVDVLALAVIARMALRRRLASPED